MFLPFLGHVISGTFYLAFIFFHQWPAQYLWITSVYNLFGGYTVLQIAMYGYIGDVTNDKYLQLLLLLPKQRLKLSYLIMFVFSERTTLMSILAGLGIAVFPLADFLSGQIYNVKRDYPVWYLKTWNPFSGRRILRGIWNIFGFHNHWLRVYLCYTRECYFEVYRISPISQNQRSLMRHFLGLLKLIIARLLRRAKKK